MDVKLPCGKITEIDDCDAYLKDVFPFWRSHKGERVIITRYIQTEFGVVRQDVYLHKAICKSVGNLVVDHIDRNALNNKRSNLRLCMHSQNSVNRTKSKNKTSKYHGVSRNKSCKSKPWSVYMRKPNSTKRISKQFATEKEAALFFNEKSRELWGEFAPQNDIDE